eukprot:CAMPEP_0204844772 /NCGR_PEP_ID=MMETSP1347-20130617/562_1 /ASSEMBLY_ACC=CAM_ASM_000690 /TAXON_ID=215587 /ORGANISM="Aplanochytrium stocchinoi, Strain GSBS06" /LENGTH=430 /DNA_ID=CAMNT_0051984419 /DNA_START=131 /DNA_END=1423 /DNA_ORIENTATION=+
MNSPWWLITEEELEAEDVVRLKDHGLKGEKEEEAAKLEERLAAEQALAEEKASIEASEDENSTLEASEDENSTPEAHHTDHALGDTPRFNLFKLCVLLFATLPVLVPSYAMFAYHRKFNLPEGVSLTALRVLLMRVIYALKGNPDNEAAIRLARDGGLMPWNTYKAILATFEFLQKTSGVSLVPDFHKISECQEHEHTRGAMELMNLRIQYTDDAIKDAIKAKTRFQLVILGAGFDVQSYQPQVIQSAKIYGVRCFEVDKKVTQDCKIAALDKAGLDHQHVTFVPCDLGKEDWGEKLVEHGYDKNLNTVLIWEGVTYYITNDVVELCLKEFVKNLAKGSVIVFDFPLNLDKVPKSHLKGLEMIGEPWLFNLKAESNRESCEKAITSFVEKAKGLVVDRMDFVDKESELEGYPPYTFGITQVHVERAEYFY